MDPSSAPLADYFWIAGIDSIQYNDPPSPTKEASSPLPAVDSTIAEGSEDDSAEHSSEPIMGSAPRSAARHSRNNSFNRLSNLSNDTRNSIQSLEGLDMQDTNGTTASNRSSVTIRAAPSNGTVTQVSGMSDFDFDRALSKFAIERESFLDDLSFSAGAVLQSRPPLTSRAEKLKHEDAEPTGRRSPFQRVGGSIRRKLSFRDLNSARRQNMTRASKFIYFYF
jgi:hypothetical protein